MTPTDFFQSVLIGAFAGGVFLCASGFYYHIRSFLDRVVWKDEASTLGKASVIFQWARDNTEWSYVPVLFGTGAAVGALGTGAVVLLSAGVRSIFF